MFSAVIITSLCSGWLCKAVHGEEQRFPLKSRYETLEACVAQAEMVARLGGVPEPFRISCKRADDR